jgi:hypothetical protein
MVIDQYDPRLGIPLPEGVYAGVLRLGSTARRTANRPGECHHHLRRPQFGVTEANSGLTGLTRQAPISAVSKRASPLSRRRRHHAWSSCLPAETSSSSWTLPAVRSAWPAGDGLLRALSHPALLSRPPILGVKDSPWRVWQEPGSRPFCAAAGSTTTRPQKGQGHDLGLYGRIAVQPAVMSRRERMPPASGRGARCRTYGSREASDGGEETASSGCRLP